MTKQKILYGAGEMGRRAFFHYAKSNPNAVAYFADTYKGGSEYLGKLVLSFDDFLKVHKDYTVVLCIYDLFDVSAAFDKAGVTPYLIWTDANLLSQEERFPKVHALIKETEPQDLRPKIIYGAGRGGEIALQFYGEDNVYAFADQHKAGNEFHGKPVLPLAELPRLQESHNIVISIEDISSAKDSLNKAGVTKFRPCFGVGWDDIRIRNALLLEFDEDAYASNLVNEIKNLDFIQHPEYIEECLEHRRIFLKMLIGNKTNVSARTLGENKFYGIFNELLNYANRDNPSYASPAVSHGVWGYDGMNYKIDFQNLVEVGTCNKAEIHRMHTDCLYFAVGSYLHYSRPFYDDQTTMQYKKKLGKNLLIFPVHSLPNIRVSYDYRAFVDYALNEAKAFDSITVCAHYNDFRKPIIEMFKANGANIVSAGMLFDPSFIRRLKTIVQSTDAVLTNGNGSHIYYCLGINKPVKVFLQNIELNAVKGLKEATESVFSDRIADKLSALTSWEISSQQLSHFEPWVGWQQIKTQEEMGAIFDISKRIAKHCDYKRSRYTESIRATYNELRRSTVQAEKLMYALMKEALPPGY